jgi:hypothetical protein
VLDGWSWSCVYHRICFFFLGGGSAVDSASAVGSMSACATSSDEAACAVDSMSACADSSDEAAGAYCVRVCVEATCIASSDKAKEARSPAIGSI